MLDCSNYIFSIRLEESDNLCHVSCTVTKECVEVCARISEVGAPTGTVEEVCVESFAVGCSVSGCIVISGCCCFYEVDDDFVSAEAIFDDLLYCLSLSCVSCRCGVVNNVDRYRPVDCLSEFFFSLCKVFLCCFRCIPSVYTVGNVDVLVKLGIIFLFLQIRMCNF